MEARDKIERQINRLRDWPHPEAAMSESPLGGIATIDNRALIAQLSQTLREIDEALAGLGRASSAVEVSGEGASQMVVRKSVGRRTAVVLALGLLFLVVLAAAFFGLRSKASDSSLQDFEAALRGSLPRCFATSDIARVAQQISNREIRCRPIQISFSPGDPLPWKLICMPAERLPEEGSFVLAPPNLLLTVDGSCVTAVAR